MTQNRHLWTEGDDAPIERLDLPVRAYNCLKRSDIASVGQILALRKSQLLSIRSFTPAFYEEVRARLIDHGFMKPGRLLGPFVEGDDDNG